MSSIIDRVLELPEYMNGESLEEFKKRAVQASDSPAYLRECLERLSHLFPPREKLEDAIRSILAEAENEQDICVECGYQFDADATLDERCFCYHPF